MALIDEITFDSLVNQMEDEFEQRLGFRPDAVSDSGIRMRVLASQLDSIASSGRWLLKQMFYTTADGEYLERHASRCGLSRISGTKATGGLLFSIESARSYDITIPEGTVCTTAGSDPVRFIVTKSGSIAAGSTGVTLSAEALEAGCRGNVLSGAVCAVVSAPTVGLGVVNTYAFKNGSDDEDDETLRRRICETLSNPSNGTNSAFYSSAALRTDGVQSAAVFPRDGGRGKVSVYIAAAGKTADAETVSALENSLAAEKEINVDVSVYAATTSAVSISLKLKPCGGYAFSDIKTECAEIISDYFAGLSIGDEFSVNNLGRKLLNGCAGLADYSFVQPTANHSVASKQLAVCGTVTLTEWS